MATLHEIKVQAVRDALVVTRGNVVVAARLLGVGKSTMYRIIHDNGIVVHIEQRDANMVDRQIKRESLR